MPIVYLDYDDDDTEYDDEDVEYDGGFDVVADTVRPYVDKLDIYSVQSDELRDKIEIYGPQPHYIKKISPYS